jgi:GT2 family glycosyltransferase
MMLEENEMARRLMNKGKVVYQRDIVVVTSGRRGDEGLGIVARYMRALFFYIVLKRGDLVGFTDIRS